MKRIRNDHGQATVLTVLFLVALIGMGALVLDLGSWFREQRDTQSDADAAALAAAQELPGSVADADALGREFLVKNGDSAVPDITFSKKFANNDTVTVRVNRSAPGVFAKVFGIDSVAVGAKATARASGLQAARWVAPIVVNIKHEKLNCGEDAERRPVPCFGDPTELTLAHLHGPGSGTGAGSFSLINLDSDDSGSVGGSTIGDWIEQGFDEYMEIGKYTAVPSAEFNDSHVKGALAVRMNDVLLFPIYKTITGSGTNAEFDVVGWVGFRVTSFDASGSSGKVKGAFTEVIWEGIQSTSGANLNYGVRSVALVE
jgi:Putative Flp pilus-assembly TadE/G-like